MNATDEKAAFLRAILSEPEDDTPRLVFADWLDENAGTVPCPSCALILSPDRGGCWPCPTCGASEWSERGLVPDGFRERAEFIRVQVELAALGDPDERLILAAKAKDGDEMYRAASDGMRLKELRARERELWNYGDPNSWVITEPMPFQECIRCIDEESISTALRLGLPVVIYRRGFPAAITCTAENWLANADAILPRLQCPPTAHPIRKVVLATWPEIEFRGSDGGRNLNVCRVAGRMWRPIPHGDGVTSRTISLLDAEWPGIEFELPREQDAVLIEPIAPITSEFL